MPDDFDKASETEAKTLQDQLDAQRLRAACAPKLAPSGECMNPRCGEEFPAGDPRVFCGAQCANEHARLANATHFKRRA